MILKMSGGKRWILLVGFTFLFYIAWCYTQLKGVFMQIWDIKINDGGPSFPEFMKRIKLIKFKDVYYNEFKLLF